MNTLRTMLKLHLIKAAQATPFVKVLEKAGAPVNELSTRAGMPIDAVTAGKGVIGEYCLWRFVDLAAKYQRHYLLGYDAANQYPVNSIVGLGGLRTRTATTLKELLEYFIEDVQTESTGCSYTLVPDPAGIWFVRELMFGEKRKNWQAEQYVIAIIIQIIRLCTGPEWLPPEVKVSSSNIALPIPKEWQSIKLVWGSKATEIRVPEKLMALPVTKQPTQKTSDHDNAPDRVQKTHLDFAQLVKTQIQTNTIGLENAAQQTGLSTKTLKRKLLQDNTSYTKILDQQRLELAQLKLNISEIPIHTIAQELGYDHQANFTRAFKRMHGITPQEYRNQQGL